ncbi:MAG: xanthine dehydrogenase family protein molybdopterin-binding subunit [Gammaproteobacteria bacterium]|nr:xanthine dehydrogenase family protein molybdopterin-binding subunit [Gammaproteobacteria bacterium]
MTALPKAFGQSVKRKEDRRFITGRGRYTDDLQLEGQTFAAFVRSPYPHARILSFDTTEALVSPGVIAVFTGADYAKSGLRHLQCGWMIHSRDGSPMKVGEHPALADQIVRYVGDAVAVVIAHSRSAARSGAELVNVEYDELPAVTGVEAAGHPDAPQLHSGIPENQVFDWELGNGADVDAAFNKAAHVTDLTLINNRLAPNAMETRAVNAVYDSGRDHYTLYVASQNPHGLRMTLAAVIGLGPEHHIRVISEDVGGGFGSKAFNYAEEVVCLWAARQIGHPVKWAADRSEALLTDAHGRDHITKASLALDSNHRITAMRVFTEANIGAYLSTFGTLVPTYVYAPLLSGQYHIPAIHCRVIARYTNTTPVDAYRGAGRPEAGYVVERLVDAAARDIGMDPAEFRRRNFIRSFPHDTPVGMTYDTGDFEAHLNRALEAADAKGFPARKTRAEGCGHYRGLGIGCYIEAAGIGPSAKLAKLGAGAGLWESAQVRVNPTGSVEVLTGCHSHGQGHETTYAQLVADRFGIAVEDVDVIHGDTDRIQFGMGTYGSRSGPVGLSAIALTCDKIVAKAKQIAAHLMKVPADSITFEDGEFASPFSNQRLRFSEVALAAYTAHHFPTAEIEPGLKETTFFDPPDFNFPAGTHVCEVEIDGDTGVVRVVNFTAVDDFGTVGNPMIVEGQVHGGIVQGIGQALLENVVFDGSGQPLTGTFMDYCMPRADDVPDFTVGFTCTPSTTNPLGMKGCGEAGAIGAPPAVMNAIIDALGTRDLQMPATPEKVWRVIRDLRSANRK